MKATKLTHDSAVDKIKSLCQKHGLSISTDGDNNIILSDGYMADNATAVCDHLAWTDEPWKMLCEDKSFLAGLESILSRHHSHPKDCSFKRNYRGQSIVEDWDGSLVAVYDC